MTGETVTRRALLRILAGLSLGAPWLASCEGESSQPCHPGEGVSTLFADPESAAAIGRRFLVARPEEADATRLGEALGLRGDAGDPRPGRPDGEALAERLRAIHVEDLTRGRVVNLGGWIFSRTEARLAALVALCSEGSA